MDFKRNASGLAGGVLLLVASAGLVRADVIDGEWCNDAGRHFTIKGPDIVTPDGTRTTGTYSRHAFSYTAPASEPNGGTMIVMRLMNEQTVNLRVGPDPTSPAEVWTRCKPIS